MAETKAGPAITTASLPKPVAVPLSQQPPAVQQAAKSAVEAVYNEDEPIVAAPLIEPDFVNLKPKNPAISFRWILQALYKQDGTQSILRFEQAKAQGYAVATKADIVNPPVAYERDNGTKYINGDLILMKIDKRKYKGAILHREQQAAKQMLATGQEGKRMLRNDLAGKGSRSQLNKISAFDPTNDLREFVKSGELESDLIDE